MDVNIVDKLS